VQAATAAGASDQLAALEPRIDRSFLRRRRGGFCVLMIEIPGVMLHPRSHRDWGAFLFFSPTSIIVLVS
jgi:hypothetical protein